MAVVGSLTGIRAIAVTGPQRSGTTFTAKAIAHDTGWLYVDEQAFGINDRRRWLNQLQRERVVVQCPSMMRYVHDLPNDVLVVVMLRPVAEILASQDRIGWRWDRVELERYGLLDGVISEVKYRWWHTHKHEGPARWVEVNYRDMKDHPLWVDDRAGFGPKQTEADGG